MARSHRSIYWALAANIGIAITKFIAGGFSKSSAMISEGIHSLVDSVNELLLLYGIYRSNRQRDKDHPFGYGRELYFWSFIVAILIFALGAGVSFLQGFHQLKNPALPGKIGWSYAVLAFSLLFDGSSFLVALRDFKKTRSKRTRGKESLWASVRNSKDPGSFMVLFEDGAAVLGVGVVAICLFTGQLTKSPYLDGIASISVGIILTASSALLARESRSLLMGEGISSRTEQQINDIIQEDRSTRVKRFFSIYQSPEEVLIVVIIAFQPQLTTTALNSKITGIKKKIREKFPKINDIIIQPA
jgi:cation diffusion facilitator family transporter